MVKWYNVKFDATYDKEEDRWLEGRCLDPHCTYCPDRPTNPSAADQTEDHMLKGRD